MLTRMPGAGGPRPTYRGPGGTTTAAPQAQAPTATPEPAPAPAPGSRTRGVTPQGYAPAVPTLQQPGPTPGGPRFGMPPGGGYQAPEPYTPGKGDRVDKRGRPTDYIGNPIQQKPMGRPRWMPQQAPQMPMGGGFNQFPGMGQIYYTNGIGPGGPAPQQGPGKDYDAQMMQLQQMMGPK